jgi:hypothetical protein
VPSCDISRLRRRGRLEVLSSVSVDDSPPDSVREVPPPSSRLRSSRGHPHRVASPPAFGREVPPPPATSPSLRPGGAPRRCPHLRLARLAPRPSPSYRWEVPPPSSTPPIRAASQAVPQPSAGRCPQEVPHPAARPCGRPAHNWASSQPVRRLRTGGPPRPPGRSAAGAPASAGQALAQPRFLPRRCGDRARQDHGAEDRRNRQPLPSTVTAMTAAERAR